MDEVFKDFLKNVDESFLKIGKSILHHETPVFLAASTLLLGVKAMNMGSNLLDKIFSRSTIDHSEDIFDSRKAKVSRDQRSYNPTFKKFSIDKSLIQSAEQGAILTTVIGALKPGLAKYAAPMFLGTTAALQAHKEIRQRGIAPSAAVMTTAGAAIAAHMAGKGFENVLTSQFRMVNEKVASQLAKVGGNGEAINSFLNKMFGSKYAYSLTALAVFPAAMAAMRKASKLYTDTRQKFHSTSAVQGSKMSGAMVNRNHNYVVPSQAQHSTTMNITGTINSHYNHEDAMRSIS